MKELKSKCCDSLVRTEIWVSKEKRRVRYCLCCGEPCEIKKIKEEKMQIERQDGTKEKRTYDSIDLMMEDAEKVIRDPSTKKIILWPKLKIPKRKR